MTTPTAKRAAGARRRPCGAALIAALFGGGLHAAGAAPSLPTGPLVQLIDATEYEDHADVSIQFSCSMRFMSTVPADHGANVSIRLLLGPDCGPPTRTIPPELPLVGGGADLVRGARVESMMPGEITVQLSFTRPVDFVMVPTTSGLGLRLRLLHTNPRRGSVRLAAPRASTGYAVNLESAATPFLPAAVAEAARAFDTQAYVSQTTVGGAPWYRLRIGPFETREAAEKALRAATARYPHAWITEEQPATGLAQMPAARGRAAAVALRTDAPLHDAERARLLREARVALAQHRYPRTVDLLTRLVRQPEYPGRAEAQELLGLTRERAGQLAEAKAEYQEYLRRYPQGPAATSVRMRLQILAAASLQPKSLGRSRAAGERRFTAAGGASLSYAYGRDQSTVLGATTTTNSISEGIVYGDLLLRDRGPRFDLSTRADGGYTRNFAVVPPTAVGQDQVTAAYGQIVDRRFGLTARLGRQSVATVGVVGLFDGLYFGYQPNPRWSVSAAVGLPAYTNYSALSARQKFGTVTAEYGSRSRAWVFDVYAFDETDEIGTERRSVGLQSRYSGPGRTAVLLVDYDVAFKQLNSATLIGNAKLGSSWVFGFDADHRRSPPLGLSNALIGQSTTDLRALAALYTPSQLEQMALDRTATSDTVVISANRAIGAHWQFMTDLSALELSGTPASFGVVATRATGLDKSASVQVSGASLLQTGDVHLLGLRFDDSPTARSETISWDARFVVYREWRVGPQLSVERLNDFSLGGSQMIYLPQLQTDWTGRNSIVEITAGYQILNQATPTQPLPVTGLPATAGFADRSLYVTAAYRVRF